MRIIAAIDGACRGNGKPDCMSSGAAYIHHLKKFNIRVAIDKPSSNSRGEMCGLIEALNFATHENDLTEMILVMDSEYLFNAITKDWIGNWERKGWITAQGTSVKNQDLWKIVKLHLDALDELGVELVPYHIKGHLVSLGTVSAKKSLEADPTGHELYTKIWEKYELDKVKKPEKWHEAIELFERNNGFIPPEAVFKRFVVLNTVTDYIATTTLDRAALASS